MPRMRKPQTTLTYKGSKPREYIRVHFRFEKCLPSYKKKFRGKKYIKKALQKIFAHIYFLNTKIKR